MTDSTPRVASGRIFMSYRREETAFPADWLFNRLADHFGRDKVFKDVDSIQLGDDFVEVITAAVESCDVLLVLIGDRWLTITDGRGRRRLSNPADFVRLEIEAALARDVPVIPILVEGAQMPGVDELPASLAQLVSCQALELSPSRFDFDIERLLRVLDRTITEAEAHEGVGQKAEEAAARRRLIEQLPTQMREHAAAQDWDAVLAASDRLAGLDPDAADDALASTVRDEVTRRQQAEETAAVRRLTEDLPKGGRRRSYAKRHHSKAIRRSQAIGKYSEIQWSSGAAAQVSTGWSGQAPQHFRIVTAIESDNALSRAVRAAVRPGLLSFNPPSVMTQGRSERVEVRIARSPELREALAAGLRGRGKPQFEEINTSPFMGVELLGAAFEITSFSPLEQLVAPIACWEFDIRPVRSGRQTLILCVSLRIDSPVATDGRIAIPVLEREIQIRVDVVFGTRRFLAANWQWLIATILGLGGALVAWITFIH